MPQRAFLTALIFSLCSLCYSQGSIKYNIKVLDRQGEPVEGLLISAIEKSLLHQEVDNTDNNGQAFLKLEDGNKWLFSIGEIKDAFQVKALPGKIVTYNEEYAYDLEHYARKLAQDKFRDDERFTIIDASGIDENTPFEPGSCKLKLLLNPVSGVSLANISVSMINLRDSIKYTGKTNDEGHVFFIVPNRTNYDIDINELKNFSYFDFEDIYASAEYRLDYVPTILDEKIINDTIYQTLSLNSQSSTERALVSIALRGGNNKGKNEEIFLRDMNNNKVYAGKSNENGLVKFLLPIHTIYLIDFTYQKNADAINLIDARATTSYSADVFYQPDPRLETPELFVPTPERLFLHQFNNFLSKQYEKPVDKPFSLKIFSAKKLNKNSQEALFTLTLAGSEKYGEESRHKLNLAFVLDKSGSMYSNGRSEALKSSLLEIGELLSEEDEVSVILFDTDASIVNHTFTNHLDVFEFIAENYTPGGGTSIYTGILSGVDQLKENFDVEKLNRIILLTDGYGETPPVTITDYIEEQFQRGIEFSAIGLGHDYNQALLELIARKGNGTFSFVEDTSALSAIFTTEIENAFHYAVSDLQIEITHDSILGFKNLLGFPIEKKNEGSVFFKIHKVPASTNKIAFLKFNVENPTAEIVKYPIVLKISYFDNVLGKKVSYEQEVYLEWTEETDTELKLDQEEKTLYAIAILNQSMKTMAEAYAEGDNKRAKYHLKEGIAQLSEIFPDAKPREVKALLKQANDYLLSFEQMERNKKIN